MKYSDFSYLKVEVDEGVAVVRMPADPVGPDFYERLHPMHSELRDIYTPLAADPDVRAVVLTGSGETFFAGPGLEPTMRLLSSGLAAGAKQILEGRQIIGRLLEFDKPLVAAVNGISISMGCQLAFLSDFAVASRTAVFQDTHVRLGLPAGDGGTMLWPLLVGMPKARTLLLRGHPLSAGEALELGLVTEVTNPDEVVPTAVQLARKLGHLPRFAYAATRLALNQWFRMSAAFSLDLALGMELASFGGDEFRTQIALARAKLEKESSTDRE